MKQEHLWEIQNGLLVLFLTISVLVLMEGSAPWSTLAAWSRTLADRVAHLLVNIQSASEFNFEPLVDPIALENKGTQKRALELVH